MCRALSNDQVAEIVGYLVAECLEKHGEALKRPLRSVRFSCEFELSSTGRELECQTDRDAINDHLALELSAFTQHRVRVVAYSATVFVELHSWVR